MSCFDDIPEDREPSYSCRDCDGSGEVFVKRNAQGRVDYLSGRVINNETTRQVGL